jgi:hypothetical protein
VKKNVGTFDAYMRISFGLMGLACGIAGMVRRPYRSLPYIIAGMGAIKVAEGVTRWCPMLTALNVETIDRGEQPQGDLFAANHQD